MCTSSRHRRSSGTCSVNRYLYFVFLFISIFFRRFVSSTAPLQDIFRKCSVHLTYHRYRVARRCMARRRGHHFIHRFDPPLDVHRVNRSYVHTHPRRRWHRGPTCMIRENQTSKRRTTSTRTHRDRCRTGVSERAQQVSYF